MLSEVMAVFRLGAVVGPVIFKSFSTVERLMAIRMSGLISLPFCMNQRMVLALVGKFGSQFESRNLYQP